MRWVASEPGSFRFGRGGGCGCDFGGLDEFRDEFLGFPVVADEGGLDASRGVDDDGAEVVVEDGAFAGKAEAELLGEGVDLDLGAGGEAPVGGVGLIAGGVAFEDGGGVEFDVEGDREEIPVGGRVGGGGEFAGDGLEVVAHAGTEFGERAAGEDEGEGEGLTLELAEGDGLAEVVGEGIVGERVADGEGLDVANAAEGAFGWGGVVGGRGFAGFGDLIDPAFVIGDDHAEKDLVARLEAGEFIGVFDAEGHGHGLHVIGDGLVIDDGGAAVGLEFLDDAFDEVEIGLGAGGGGLGRGGRGGLFATGGEQKQEGGEETSGLVLVHSGRGEFRHLAGGWQGVRGAAVL